MFTFSSPRILHTIYIFMAISLHYNSGFVRVPNMYMVVEQLFFQLSVASKQIFVLDMHLDFPLHPISMRIAQFHLCIHVRVLMSQYQEYVLQNYTCFFSFFLRVTTHVFFSYPILRSLIVICCFNGNRQGVQGEL